LSNLKEDPLAKKHNLNFTPKTDDFGESFAKLWSELHGGITSPKVGMILGDTKTGQIAEEFMKFIERQSHSKVEVINFFNECFVIKDSEEADNIRKSSKVTSYFFSKFVKEV